MAPSLAISEIFSLKEWHDLEIWVWGSSRSFYTPPVFSAPTGDDHVGISWRCLMLVKLEWLGYRIVKKTDYLLSRFHLIPECNGQTDRRTDGRTDRFAISISRVSMLTRDKNDLQQLRILYVRCSQKLLPPELLLLARISTKSFVGWGFAPDPTGGAYSAPQTP